MLRRVLAAQPPLPLPQPSRAAQIGKAAAATQRPKATATLVDQAGAPLSGREALYQRWVNESATRLPTMRVTVRAPRADEQPPANAGAWVSGNEIVVPQGTNLSRHQLLHELGHVFDASYLTPQARAEISSRDLHDSGPWQSPGDPTDGATPGTEETFAEVFAALAQHKRLAPGYVGPNYAASRPLSLAAQRDLRYKLAILAKYTVQDGKLVPRQP
jgi:hypothetical protein